jgi:hypothetical protein
MAKVMIKCPATSHAISTGVEVDSDAAFDSLLGVAYHTDCPLCGNTHTWFKHDAWIAEPPNLGVERQGRDGGLAFRDAVAANGGPPG